MAKTAAHDVSCRRCKHYRISWDPRAPHACTAMGFKSQKLPCVVVYESSGIECQLYAAKPEKPTTPR
ncbi:MAG TPA: uracil-DNA glycosylase [Chloroflexota bacterium]|nr:uracil-DNA glycosylase [Chloroflexota bacterium]